MSEKDEILRNILRLYDTVPPRTILFAGFENKPPGQVQITEYDRFIYTLSGTKRIAASINNEFCTLELHGGDILYIPKYAWVRQDWTSVHEKISLVFYPEFIRSLYFDLDGSVSFPPPTYFYHTDKPLLPIGQLLLTSLDQMDNDPKWQKPALSIFSALIDLVVDQISHSEQFEESKAHQTWRKVSAYLCDHVTDNIGREQVARLFDLNPSYVSRLFRRFSGMSFQQYFDKMRMQLAENFLSNPELTIELIAQKCGYNSSSYFIRTFRKYYHTSPDKYRQSAITKAM